MLGVLEFDELDVASDLSAFHRVDDWEAMDAPRYLALVPRLPAYKGMVRLRIEAAAGRDNEPVTVDENTSMAPLLASGWGEHKIEGATE